MTICSVSSSLQIDVPPTNSVFYSSQLVHSSTRLFYQSIFTIRYSFQLILFAFNLASILFSKALITRFVSISYAKLNFIRGYQFFNRVAP